MDARRESEPTPVKNHTTVERKSEREFVVTRTFNAPARLVFEAWTKPELLKLWWAPKSMGVPLLSCEADVRVGGQYRIVFGLDDSKTMEFFGRYIEVTPHSRLVWTNDEGDGGEAITTVTFEEKGGKTLLVLNGTPSLEGSCRRCHRLRGGAARDVRATGRASRHPGSRSITITTTADPSPRCGSVSLGTQVPCSLFEELRDVEIDANRFPTLWPPKLQYVEVPAAFRGE